MPTIKELREQTPAGYNMAMEVPLDYELKGNDHILEDFEKNGCIVLKEASGALGVLRAMETRRQGIQKRMYLDGGEHRILHLMFFEADGTTQAVIHSHNFIIHEDLAYAQDGN